MSTNATALHAVGPEVFRLDGRSALVTGGASGLGAAMARGLAAAGAAVAIVDRNLPAAEAVAGAIESAGGSAFAIQADVVDEAAADVSVRRAVERWGRLDILINSAGVSRRGWVADYPLDEFERVLRVNVVGTFLYCRAAGRVMLEAGDGRIVNIASIAGLIGYGGNPAYLASKGGVVQLTRATAMEWATRGVRVNAIAPCVIETPPLLEQVKREPEFYKAFLARHPMGRFGRAEEIVGPAIFLCSDASSLITGHILPVDGGYTAM